MIKSNISTKSVLIQLWKAISPKRKRQVLISFLLMIISGFAEVLSLAFIFPFLSVLTNPQKLWNIGLIKELSFILGFKTSLDLILPVTIIFILSTIISSSVRLLNLWYYNRLAVSIGSDLSCASYEKILHLPYINHIQQNSSKYISTIVNQVSRSIDVISQFLQLFTGIILMISLTMALLIANFSLTSLAIIIFGSIYIYISRITKQKLSKNSLHVSKARQIQIKSLQEGFGAIRDVLMSGNQNTYINIFRKTDIPMRRYEAQSSFIGMFPRFALETFGLTFIAISSYVLFIVSDDFNKYIPTLATFALGVQKLLPAMQSSYNALTAIRGNIVSVVDVLSIISKNNSEKDIYESSNTLGFKNSLKICNLCFRYKKDQPFILNNINLEILQGERIGIIGRSGSGKSTLLEILMGLLEPSEGKILIDGIDINNLNKPNLIYQWRRKISYVPQSIFLADSSFSENIAFGVPENKINFELVKDCARRAKISDLIEKSKFGYTTKVGEKGIQLSGGQCQRIGIARALYKKNNIIFFDEATSSLDKETEEEVMESIKNLSNENLTIIIIAHRLSTVRLCDKVYKIEDGNLKFTVI